MDVNDLLKHPPFDDVGADVAAALAAPSFLQGFPSGVVLCGQLAPADFLFVLVEGRVELRGQSDERHHVCAMQDAGSLLLADAVVLQAPSLVEVRTDTPCRVIMIPAPVVRWAMAQDLAFARSLVASLAIDYRHTLLDLHEQKLRNGLERVAAWALREARHASDVAPGSNPRFTMRHSKRVLAELVGMTPENLSRSIPILEGSGLRIRGKVVEITDAGKLQAFAQAIPVLERP